MRTPTIAPIAAFSDNYIWCIHDERVAIVVDPGDANVVTAYLESKQLALSGILVTHHHWDHINGILALTDLWPGIPVWGPSRESIPGRTAALHHHDNVTLPIGIRLQVLELPGHTLGHIGYYCADFASSGPVLFCGDTLFSSGCGRLFEGTPEQMYESLGLLAQLPKDTRVYCTHEYTQSNLKFALAVEPNNEAVLRRIAEVDGLRKQGIPSIPTSVGLELEVNPFLRVAHSSVIQTVTQNCGSCPADERDTFAKLREWKDHF